MSIEWDEEAQDYRINGLTEADEKAMQFNQLSDEDYIDLGILRPEEEQEAEQSYQEGQEKLNKKAQNPLTKLDEMMGYVSPKLDKEYEQLSVGESWADMGKAVGTEALHLFQRQKDYDGILSPLNMLPYESQYEAKTHFAENMKYLYRYGVSTAVTFLGVGAVGKIPQLAKVSAFLLGKSANLAKAIEAGKAVDATRKAKIVGKAAEGAQGAISGTLAGAMSDFVVGRPDEGEGLIGDMFPEEDRNAVMDFFSTKETDSGLQWRLRNSIQGVVMGGVLGGLGGLVAEPIKRGIGEPIVNAWMKVFGSTKKVVQAETPEAMGTAAKELEIDIAKAEKVSDSADLIVNVNQAIKEAQEQGIEDIESHVFSKGFSKGQESTVKDIYDKLMTEQTPTILEDGTISIKVNKWQDASEVSVEDLSKQLNNDGIEFMDKSVEDTWRSRNLLAENEQLIKTEQKGANKTKITVNTKAVNRIKDYYVDKFKIDNKLDIEFVDGKINGQEASTTITRYKGTKVTSNKNKIGKKQIEIQELEDKITMLKGGNGEVSDPIEILEKKLAIAKNELKDLLKDEAKLNRIGNIKIMIDKNTKNPYAVLRSELEHARDFAKNTTPKDADVVGSGTHFSRYKGDNESEMSLQYVKRKADNLKARKADKRPVASMKLDDYTFEEVNSGKTTNEFYGHDTLVMKNKDGKELAYVRYKERGGHIDNPNIRIDWMENKGVEKGAARRALAKLMGKLHPDTKVYWEAVSPESVKSYQRFVKEYPDLAERINFFNNADITKDLDSTTHRLYNSEKGVIDETTGNISQNRGGTSAEVSGIDNNTKEGIVRENQGRNADIGGISENSRRGDLAEGVHPSIRGEQNSVDNVGRINPTEAIAQSKGDLNIVHKVLEDFQGNAPELKDFTWRSLGETGDDVVKYLEERGIDPTLIKEAFQKGDERFINAVMAKYAAAQKIMKDISEKIAKLPEDDVVNSKELIGMLHYLTAYCDALPSALGRGLHAVNFGYKVRDFFAVSNMVSQGINSLADILDIDLKSLNFTRGNSKEVKQACWNAVRKANPEMFDEIINNPELFQNFEAVFNEIITKKIKDKEAISSLLNDIATKEQRIEIVKGIKNCTSDASIAKTMKNFQQGLADFVIHNNLSNPHTLTNNQLSGMANSLYFPAKKIVKGMYLSFTNPERGRELIKEGYNTYLSWQSAWKDSWRLARQAFKNGDGQMINFGRRTVGVNKDTVADMYGSGATELESALGTFEAKSPADALRNALSIMTRAMGASDEWLTQMNYRGIVRAKALNQAEQMAKVLGKEGDTKFLDEEAERIFNSKFKDGKPTDMEAFAEARDIVYQTPLNGKYWNEASRENYVAKEQTLVMDAAQQLTGFVNKHPFLRIFSLFGFIRTPANILQQSLEHNPLYMVLSPAQRRLWQSSPEAKAEMLAKATMGLMSIGVGAGLASNFTITGTPPLDPQTRKALYKTGWRPYSILIDGKYYSYQGIEPVATWLSLGADAHTIFNSYIMDDKVQGWDKVFGVMGKSLQGAMASTLDKASFRNGIDQLGRIMDIAEGNVYDGKKEYDELLREAGQFLPMHGMITGMSTLGEFQSTQPQGLENVMNKYFNRGLGDYKRNVFGERQDVFNALIVSGSDSLGDMPEDSELERMAEQGYTPSEITKFDSQYQTINYKDFKSIYRDNKQSLYSLMNDKLSTIELNGQTLREAIRELVQSEEYQEAPDSNPNNSRDPDTKKEMLNTVFRMYKDAAKNEVIDEVGNEFVNSEGKTMEEVRDEIELQKEQEGSDATVNTIINDIRSFQ